MISRISLLAMTAVALSMGGFELGLTRNPELQPKFREPILAMPTVPEDHPLAVGLRANLDPKDKDRLQTVAEDLSLAQAQERQKFESELSNRLAAQQVASAKQKAALESQVAALRDQRKQIKGQLELAAKRRVDAAVELRRVESADAQIDKSKVEQRLRLKRPGKDLVVRLELADRLAQEQQREVVTRLLTLQQSEQSLRAKVVAASADKLVNQATKLRLTYAKKTLDTLSSQARWKVVQDGQYARSIEISRTFPLMVALDNRDYLGLTPQQVTKLQLLQSSFIRKFAPMREAYELQTMRKGVRVGSKKGSATCKPQTVKVFEFEGAKEKNGFVFAKDAGVMSLSGAVPETSATVVIHQAKSGEKIESGSENVAFRVTSVAAPDKSKSGAYTVKIQTVPVSKDGKPFALITNKAIALSGDTAIWSLDPTPPRGAVSIYYVTSEYNSPFEKRVRWLQNEYTQRVYEVLTREQRKKLKGLAH